MPILVVDDEHEVRESLSALLEVAGYEVITASSGAEALERLDHERVRLMLIDLSMPGMSGEEVIGKLSHDARPQVLVITALAPWQTAWLLRQGIGYLRKPIDAELLLTTVGTMLRREERINGNQIVG